MVNLFFKAHAFVKRETTENTTGANDLFKQLEELSKSLREKIPKSFDSDTFMKNFQEGIEKLKSGVSSIVFRWQ